MADTSTALITYDFTPGPWRVFLGDSSIQIKDEHGQSIAATSSKAYYERYDLTDEANARLIAAAPQLLTACEALLNATMFKNHPAESQMAIDAIAKAKGLGQ